MNAPQLPAYLANKQSRGLAQTLVGNLGAGSPPFLSIMGNRFTLIDGAGDEIPVSTFDPQKGPYLDCVIIDALERTSKIYYDKPFDPGANQYEPPACFSDNGVAPSRNASRPQARTCAECPMGAWGSKVSTVSGKQVKACNDIQKIAILVPGYEMPFLLRVPPNSRTNFRGYVNKFVGQQLDVCDVLTRITFEPGGIGTLHFDPVTYIDEATFGQREKLSAAKATDSMVGRTDLPREVSALPAAAPMQQIENQPFVPQAAPIVATSANTAPVQQPVQQVPAQQEAPTRRRRNAAQAQTPQQQGTPQQAPFMPQQASAPAANAAPGNFGIQQGAAPDAGLASTLESLFGAK